MGGGHEGGMPASERRDEVSVRTGANVKQGVAGDDLPVAVALPVVRHPGPVGAEVDGGLAWTSEPEAARSPAIAGEERYAVAIPVVIDKLHRFLIAVHPDDLSPPVQQSACEPTP